MNNASITETYLYHTYRLPISNVETDLSAPNSDGIGPFKELFPGQ